jgi:hypothetical protein
MRTNSTIKDKYDRCGECRDGKVVRVFGKPPLCHYHEVIRLRNRQAAKKAQRAANAQGDSKNALTTPVRYPHKVEGKTAAARAKKHASPFSAKEAKRQRVYGEFVAVWKKAHPHCAAKLEGCAGLTTDCHHKKGRGPHLLDTTTWLPVCRPCHQIIESMSKDEAVSRGLSMYRNRINPQ